MQSIHIGSEILKVVKRRGITSSEFARRISKSREGVYSIYRRKSIDTDLLKNISMALEYDFFIHYTPVFKEISALKEENTNLKAMMSLLRKENTKP
ncbi:MAG: hypothetical protein EP332_04605 [Bacteroidetes bacterium]|nr:MAG: hypothetical protein EP332_04605 [Bacteroidota bacterium]